MREDNIKIQTKRMLSTGNVIIKEQLTVNAI